MTKSNVISFLALIFNLLYAMYHCILGILNHSPWFMAMCAFYGTLATARFSAILYECKKQSIFVMRLSGVFLTVLSFVLAAVNYISLSQNTAARYNEIIMITLAAYTFCKITMALITTLKQHKGLRSIACADAAASVLTLQRSMLVSFGPAEPLQIYLMNAITGAIVFLFILILGISMILKSTRKDEKLWQNQNL